MSKRFFLLAVVLEVVGIATVGIGLGVEVALGGAIYFAVITLGSLLVAIGGVVFAKFVRRQ